MHLSCHMLIQIHLTAFIFYTNIITECFILRSCEGTLTRSHSHVLSGRCIWTGAAYDLLISGRRRPLFVCRLPVQPRHKSLCPISALKDREGGREDQEGCLLEALLYIFFTRFQALWPVWSRAWGAASKYQVMLLKVLNCWLCFIFSITCHSWAWSDFMAQSFGSNLFIFLPCICFVLLPSSVHKIKCAVYTCSPFPFSYICMCERKSLFLTHFTPTSSASLPRHKLIFLFPRSVLCSSLWDSPGQTPQSKLDPRGFLFLSFFLFFNVFFLLKFLKKQVSWKEAI